MSRIDRFLIFDSLILAWGIVGQLIDKRDVSDHCPIWLISNQSDWGKNPSESTIIGSIIRLSCLLWKWSEGALRLRVGAISS